MYGAYNGNNVHVVYAYENERGWSYIYQRATAYRHGNSEKETRVGSTRLYCIVSQSPEVNVFYPQERIENAPWRQQTESERGIGMQFGYTFSSEV